MMRKAEKKLLSRFYLDTEDFSQDQVNVFCGALQGLAEGDMPFFVELLLVDEEEIRKINKEQRKVDCVTDVLSFPSMDLVSGDPIFSEEHGECVESETENGVIEDRLYLGSVVICEKRARMQAEEYGHSFERELYYLAVHGILHCLGYDHQTEDERRKMREKEESVMQKLGLERKS